MVSYKMCSIVRPNCDLLLNEAFQIVEKRSPPDRKSVSHGVVLTLTLDDEENYDFLIQIHAKDSKKLVLSE
jgi:hypothetical protein